MSKKIVFFTGAGISAESGISTFRDSGGLWEEYKIEDICSAGCLDWNREKTVEFYDKRRENISDKVPNKAHLTISKLQKKYPNSIKIVTQNVDDLFEKAGCKEILHLHGFLREVVCRNRSCNYLYDIAYAKQAEKCPECGDYLRPNVVFFGEAAPKYWDMDEVLRDSYMTIIIGTSGNVLNVADIIMGSKYSILNNLEKSDAINDRIFDKVIYGTATNAINEIEKLIELLLT
ncbi:MAG: NAD-dependent deacetylase [Candidatus Cloacimonadota bacterium]|nr:MAG: NAD-dependent deacetylase [Candidatus Cloacimonadota bacterium]